MAPLRAVLFDLDETLIEEDSVVAESFAATAAVAAERNGVDGGALAAAARDHARALWRDAPGYAWCVQIGISSWEGLHCRFDGTDDRLAALRDWAPGFRRAAWGAALDELGTHDDDLAADLAERFAAERSARHRTYDDAPPLLDQLAGRYALGLVTNGAADLQREKLRLSRLGHHFASVVVSAEVGAGKPEPLVFERALDELGVAPGEAMMVGDNFKRDVEGARRLGMSAVWLDRRARPPVPGTITIASLAELPAALA